MLPTYRLSGESCEILSRGWIVYTAYLTCECDRDELCQLVGTEVHGKAVVAVESFAVADQSFKAIGLAVKK